MMTSPADDVRPAAILADTDADSLVPGRGFRSVGEIVIEGLWAQARAWRLQAAEEPTRAALLEAAATALEKRAMELARNKRVRGSGEK